MNQRRMCVVAVKFDRGNALFSVPSGKLDTRMSREHAVSATLRSLIWHSRIEKLLRQDGVYMSTRQLVTSNALLG